MSSTIHSLGPKPASRLVSEPDELGLTSPLLGLDTAAIASFDENLVAWTSGVPGYAPEPTARDGGLGVAFLFVLFMRPGGSFHTQPMSRFLVSSVPTTPAAMPQAASTTPPTHCGGLPARWMFWIISCDAVPGSATTTLSTQCQCSSVSSS